MAQLCKNVRMIKYPTLQNSESIIHKLIFVYYYLHTFTYLRNCVDFIIHYYMRPSHKVYVHF